MKYPTWDEFKEWNPAYATKVIWDSSYQNDKWIETLYKQYRTHELPVGKNESLVLAMEQFFDAWDAKQDDYLPQIDDQFIPTEDELEMQREENKWRQFFNAPPREYPFPHKVHDDEVRRLLKENLKINAIKYVRQISKMGLKEAKDWVDKFQYENQENQ